MKDYRLESTPANAQRRPELARDDDWIERFLAEAQVGHVATRWEKQPFLTPTLFWYDPERHEIYFHSNITGRIRANVDNFPEACFEASRAGKLLPSNVALEFSIQFESVIAFGNVRVIEDEIEARRALEGLLDKYFPHMQSGKHYRPITEKELKRTSIYAMIITSWSGKRNWKEQAVQSQEWPPLPSEMLA